MFIQNKDTTVSIIDLKLNLLFTFRRQMANEGKFNCFYENRKQFKAG